MTSVTRSQLSAIAPRDPALVRAFEELFRGINGSEDDVSALIIEMLTARGEISALRAKLAELQKRVDILEAAPPMRVVTAAPSCDGFPVRQQPNGWTGTHQIGTHFLTFWNGILTRLGT